MSHPYVPPSSEGSASEPTSQPSAPPNVEQPYDPSQSGGWNPPAYGQQQPASASSAADYQPSAPYGAPPTPESYPNPGFGQASYGQDPYATPPQPAYGQGGYDQVAYGQNPYEQPAYGQQPNGYAPQPYGYGGPASVRNDYAHWGKRVGAYLIDFIPTFIAVIVFYVGYGIAIAGVTSSGSTDLSGGAVPMIIGGVLYLAALGWQIYNRWITAGRTGQSLGKRVLKISLINEATNAPIGPLNAFLRDLVHIVDGFAYVGYLWPLWDEKKQTFADKLMKTVVVEAPPGSQA